MKRAMAFGVAALCLSGCATWDRAMAPQGLPSSSGEALSGYTYIPIDPFPVTTTAGAGCGTSSPFVEGDLLDALPDNAVRMLVEQFDVDGNVTYGASKVTAKNQAYRVTVDYINADTINFAAEITKYMRSRTTGKPEQVDLFSNDLIGYVAGSDSYVVNRIDAAKLASFAQTPEKHAFNIPVYIGVGLRVSANVLVVGGSANISGIGVIGAEAEAERLRGSLVVQTLGINGKAVASALPIQSELNRTTAQNAIVAVGSIKALLYGKETVVSPRVVGLYLPFPGGKPLVNSLISEMSKKAVEWPKPCLKPTAIVLGLR